MSEELIERLRSRAKDEFEYENRATGLSDLLQDAADEIERLVGEYETPHGGE